MTKRINSQLKRFFDEKPLTDWEKNFIIGCIKFQNNSNYSLFAHKKLYGNKIDKKQLKNLIKNTYYYDFEFNFINIILKFIGFKIINNKLMCSEYISYILTKLNIIKNNYHASCLPCYFEKKINTYNNFYYSNLEYFI